MNELLAARRHTWTNQAELEGSRICGCCSCMEIFTPDQIVAWAGLDMKSFDNPEANSAGTAVCPRCGDESVIGDKSGYPITPAFLSRMQQAWFQKTIIRKPAPKP